MDTSFDKSIADALAKALGVPAYMLDATADQDAIAHYQAQDKHTKRKVACGLALLQLQIPDDMRFDLLNNHLEETEQLIKSSFEELTASLVNVLSQDQDSAKSSQLNGVRLAMLMNILGFDNDTLKGVLLSPMATQAAAIASTGLNDIGLKIQQLYDEKK
ncbi:hypothetical protein pEaSNUABM52_00037 [Erwinia phage pEp_SNUABM_52]|nr:hypothetical protein pEaSNUABM52_00037 [Erwinia phage pEp_SNUABM_52]